MRNAWLAVAIVGVVIIAWNSKQATDGVPEERAFENAYHHSFRYDGESRETLLQLTDRAAAVQNAYFDAVARLPNDVAAEEALRARARALESDHFEKMEECRQRVGAPLLYPRPIDDLHYRQWWTPANTSAHTSAISHSRF